jgi:hypothetical protein
VSLLVEDFLILPEEAVVSAKAGDGRTDREGGNTGVGRNPFPRASRRIAESLMADRPCARHYQRGEKYPPMIAKASMVRPAHG